MTVVMLFTVSSCDLTELDINDDPNNPAQASLGLLLTNVQLNASATFADDMNNAAMGFMAQTDYFDSFNMTNTTFNPEWNYLWENPLKDLDAIIKATAQQRADGTPNPHYEGIAKVLKAYYFSIMVDMWGDVPYSEAFNGDAEEANLIPAFDDDAAIYPQLVTLLDEAVTHFGENSLVAVTGDVIYGGDEEKWEAAAKSLKLKLLLQMHKADASVIANINSTIAAGGFIAAGGDFEFTFGKLNNPDDRHPVYIDGYAGGDASFSYYGHQLMYEMLLNDDPRRPFYFKRQTDAILNPDDPTDKQTIPCSQRTDCIYGYFPLSNKVTQDLYGVSPTALETPAEIDATFGTVDTDSAVVVTWYVKDGAFAEPGQKVVDIDFNGTIISFNAPYRGTLNQAQPVGKNFGRNATLAEVDARAFLGGFFGRDRSDPSGIPNDNPIRTTVGLYPFAGLYDDVAEPGGGNRGSGDGIFPMLTSWMVKLHQIEAILTPAIGATGDARALFQTAMQEQFSKVNSFVSRDPDASPMPAADVTAYIDSRLALYDAAPNDASRLSVVLKQAWFMNLGNGFEIYNTFRRTGLPNGLQTPLQPPRQFALRLPYAQDEINLNTNTPTVVFDSPASAVFWDVLKFQF